MRLTGIDLSPGMLALALTRADALEVPVDLVKGNAQAPPIIDTTQARHTDPVVCESGFTIVDRRRLRLGAIERLTAAKPSTGT